ncbi:MAG: hypothetical protein HQL51_11585 [Magnetococcales bacterium]|nr:hypothetical protein [Magnetococcales bacterium]
MNSPHPHRPAGGRLAALLGLLLPAVPTLAAECPPALEPATFEWEQFVVDPVIDNSQTQQWIQTQPGGNPRTRAQTRSHVQTKIDLKFQYQTDKLSGVTCAYLKKAKFLFAIDELRVFIPDRFKPGTCQFTTLETHEREHVALSRAALQEAAPQIEQEMRRAVQEVKPIPSEDKQKAGQAIGQPLAALLKTQKEAFNARHNARQKTIDTPQNYAVVEGYCPSW